MIFFHKGQMKVSQFKLLSFLIFIAYAHFSFGQQPSHYIIGEEELAGIDVYDIKQDEQRIYWLGTNQGMIKYDGYTFKTINCSEMLSTSVFDLQFDKDKNLYCKNLSGQIFQIKNDSCKIYYTIPDSLMTHEFYYSFTNENELIIASNSIFKVLAKKIIKTLEKIEQNNSYSIFFKTINGSLLIHNYSTNNVLEIKNDKITLTNTPPNFDLVIQYFYLNNKLFAYDKRSGQFLNANNYTPIQSFILNNYKKELLRYYTDNKTLWTAIQSGGIKIYDTNLSPLYNGNTAFENTFISTFCKDAEGNIILGTFGEGLIVISNFNSSEIILPDINAKITRITSAKDNTIFLGTQDGRIYKIDSSNNASIFQKTHTKNIEFLEYITETNQLLIDDKSPLLINISNEKEKSYAWGAIKDIYKITNGKYLLASNKGVYILFFSEGNVKNEILFAYEGRTNCIGYDRINKTIYAGSSTGLKIGTEENFDYFTLKGEPVLCKDILYLDGKIYITTHTNGVLIFKNKKLTANWTVKTGLISNNTKHIKTYQNKIYLTTDLGLQIIDTSGNVFMTLSKSEGLYTNNIIDFEIQNENLWLVHQKGVQTININELKPQNFKPSIKFTKLVVNDSILITNNKNKFDYTQNKFQFTVSSSSIKYNNDIKYHYQLIGADNAWQEANYENNKIEYKLLQPGNYTFMIRASYWNIESNLISYSFKINPPIWNTWWFYTILTILFILIIIIVFNYQLKKQKKKIKLQNELNAAKLIAIQSQMNPHFIFNTINSIQNLILKGDIDNSYNYIIKLSKLVRQTLNFSDKDFIDIEDEVNLLEIYLALEKLRFKDDFSYEINLNNLNDVQIPPMLIQPFVENAIKHGLLHKEGEKKLTITFTDGDVISCRIADNGIGRKKAQEIKDRQHKNHQSFSVNATKTRFDIMKAHYKQNLGVQYIDLYKSGESAGTEVIILLPINQRY